MVAPVISRFDFFHFRKSLRLFVDPEGLLELPDDEYYGPKPQEMTETAPNFNTVPALTRQISLETPRQPEKNEFERILGSCQSVGRYEKRNFKNLIPQILAALVVASTHIVLGISLVYTAILVPQLKDDPTFEKISLEKASWIVSVISLTTPIFVLLAGYLMDKFGRLNTLKLATIPGVAGWITIALSHNFPTLMAGRILTSVALALGASPTVVYVTEIARADMRGSLISFMPTLTSLGMVLTYVKGYLMDWRTVAWTCTIYTVIPAILIHFVPESPAWLVSKRRHSAAKNSLDWFNRHQPLPEDKTATLTELQLALLEKDRDEKMADAVRNDQASVMQGLMKPTGIKPMLIMIALFTFQRLSGIFTVLFYSITFFQEIGTTVDPYLASIAIATVRMVMSMINSYVLSRSKRRPLMMISCVGTAICIFASGLFTSWIKTGSTEWTSAPVVLLVSFIILSMIGFIPVPISMMAEVFPLEIRGIAYAICNASGHVIMFLSLKSYPWLLTLCGGMAGVQYFFAVVCLLCFVFTLVVLPETYNMKLRDIEEYFKNHTIYLCNKKKNNVETDCNDVE